MQKRLALFYGDIKLQRKRKKKTKKSNIRFINFFFSSSLFTPFYAAFNRTALQVSGDRIPPPYPWRFSLFELQTRRGPYPIITRVASRRRPGKLKLIVERSRAGFRALGAMVGRGGMDEVDPTIVNRTPGRLREQSSRDETWMKRGRRYSRG